MIMAKNKIHFSYRYITPGILEAKLQRWYSIKYSL
jgi:hypothetical protein